MPAWQTKTCGGVRARNAPRRTFETSATPCSIATGAAAVLVSFVIKTFLVRSFYIPSGSMEQTLMIKDRILVDELTPRFSGYDRGDVVVFRDPGGWLPVTTTPDRGPLVESFDWLMSLVGISAPDSEDHLIKRIIGVAGDHVVCCNQLGQVEVNGTPIDETPYLDLAEGQNAPQVVPYDVTVPEGSLWVLGDNRDHSRDSRYNMDHDQALPQGSTATGSGASGTHHLFPYLSRSTCGGRRK